MNPRIPDTISTIPAINNIILLLSEIYRAVNIASKPKPRQVRPRPGDVPSSKIRRPPGRLFGGFCGFSGDPRNLCGGFLNSCGSSRNLCGNPRSLCGDPRNLCGGFLNSCGNSRSLCGNSRSLCGNPLSLCGDPRNLCGGFLNSYVSLHNSCVDPSVSLRRTLVSPRGAHVWLKPAYLYCTLLPLLAPEHVDFTRLHRLAVRLIVPTHVCRNVCPTFKRKYMPHTYAEMYA